MGPLAKRGWHSLVKREIQLPVFDRHSQRINILVKRVVCDMTAINGEKGALGSRLLVVVVQVFLHF